MPQLLFNLLTDLRYALRQVRRAPGFAFSVILVLALGIGANAAMFTILEATLFRPLPYTSPASLVRLNVTDRSDKPSWLHLADLLIWRDRSRTLSSIAYYESNLVYLTAQTAGHTLTDQHVTAVAASANLFSTLGVAPALGRTFTDQEQQPGKEHVAVLSDAVWRSQFNADPNVLGQLIHLDDTVATVIGVMPPRFIFPAAQPGAQIWQPVPIPASALARDYTAPVYRAIARRAPGATLAAVQTELSDLQKQINPLYHEDQFSPLRVTPADYRRSLNAADQRTALLALLAAVAALWLISCANVASLMLARTAARRREIAVRSALGATSGRLIRQTLVESLLLAGIGSLLGLAVAQGTLALFRHSLLTQLSPDISLHPDARVLAALFGLTLLSALFFGLVPARLAASIDVEQALRQDGAQSGTSRSQHRLQRTLVVAELALTLSLLVACGLLLRTVFALRQVPLGFRTDHVFVLQPHLPDYKYRKLDPTSTVYKPLLARLQAIPGVQAAAITTIVPLSTTFNSSFSLLMDGDKKKGAAPIRITARLRAAGIDYQKILGFPMTRGRFFTAEDAPGTPLVAVANQAFAKLYESNGEDVFKFKLEMNGQPIKIIGVMADFHQAAIGNPAEPEFDVDATQMGPTDAFYQATLKTHVELLLRSTRDPKSLTPEIEHVMQQLNPDLNGTAIVTMDQVVEDAMGSQLLAAHLLEALGALALIVALAGLWSLLSYLVTLRTRELGLRLALGAQRSDILNLILRGAGGLLLTGIALGIGLSLLGTRLLSGFLFGVRQNDLFTLASASLLLFLVGAVAALLPARRAARLEPMQALRTE